MKHPVGAWYCFFTVNGNMINVRRFNEEEGVGFRRIYKALSIQDNPLSNNGTVEHARELYDDDDVLADSPEAAGALQGLALCYVTKDRDVACVADFDF